MTLVQRGKTRPGRMSASKSSDRHAADKHNAERRHQIPMLPFKVTNGSEYRGWTASTREPDDVDHGGGHRCVERSAALDATSRPLYSGLQAGTMRTRELIEQSPQIYLQAQATRELPPPSATQRFLQDLGALGGIARRAHRVPEGRLLACSFSQLAPSSGRTDMA
jgi:hypothetical protein